MNHRPIVTRLAVLALLLMTYAAGHDTARKSAPPCPPQTTAAP
jgi:hypothetical protein